MAERIHLASWVLSLEADWVSVISSLLSRKQLLQKGLQQRLQWGGRFRASGAVGRWEEEEGRGEEEAWSPAS